MVDWLFGAVPFLIAFGVISAVFGIGRVKDRARAFKVALISFALASVVFLLSVIIWSAGAIPVVSHASAQIWATAA